MENKWLSCCLADMWPILPTSFEQQFDKGQLLRANKKQLSMGIKSCL
jgi:hypothetical protein